MTIEVKHTTQAVGTDAGNGEIAKTQWNEAHTINMATGNLLGRSTAGAGTVEEIAIGSGLSLSAGTLSASGGGGGALTISNKTAAYTVVAGDLGTIIQFTSTGAVTCSLTSAATVGAGFNCWIWSDKSTGSLTIDPAGAETISGTTTLSVSRGQGVQIVSDGTNWTVNAWRWPQSFSFDNGNTSAARATTSATGAMAVGYAANATSGYATSIGANSSGGGSQAVTGAGAMALGGSYASGTDSFAAAVANNTSSYGATGNNALAMGNLAKAPSSNAVAIGSGTQATGASSVAIGTNAAALSTASFAIGNGAKALEYGKFSQAGYSGFGNGLAQFGWINYVGATTDATAKRLTSNNGGASSTNQLILPNNSAYAFSGIVVARRQAAGGTESAAWKVEGLIRREANEASTTLVFSTVTPISNVPLWTLALSADTTNGGLAVTATGAAATNIRWVATIQTSEVTYA